MSNKLFLPITINELDGRSSGSSGSNTTDAASGTTTTTAAGGTTTGTTSANGATDTVVSNPDGTIGVVVPVYMELFPFFIKVRGEENQVIPRILQVSVVWRSVV